MSVIGNEFSGLPIADLIGGPLKAACDAQIRLARATADFITNVGFNRDVDANGKPTGKLIPRQVDFSFYKPAPLPLIETPASGTVTLAVAQGAVTTQGAVTSVKVNSIEVLGKTVPFNTTLAQTAIDVAAQINSFANDPAYSATAPKYSAKALAATVTITAGSGTGNSPNGWALVASVTANPNDNLTANTTAMAGGAHGGGDSTVQKVVLSVPFLAIVNVPALMVKTVDITFDMEVKSSESHKDEQSEEASLDATGRGGWGPVSVEVKIHGAISAHSENTRSTDRSAKYHVAVHASDDGMPEGLSRVLDILQKAIAPVSVSPPQTLQQANVAQLTK